MTRRGFSLRLVHVAPVAPLFLVVLFATSPIQDNSFLWHIRAGAIQLKTLRVITEDPFSIDFAGSAWLTQSWLLELLYAEFEQMFASLAWANIMVAVLGASTVALIGVSIYRASRSPIVAGFSMVVIVWLAGPFLQPRPVIASFLLLAALVLVLQNRDRVVWLVIPIIWLWAAVHGSWVIGGGLVVLEWLRVKDPRVLKAGAVALATTLLTAHGIGVWQILLDFAAAQGALDLMQEWMVPDFGRLMQAPYLLIVGGVIIAAVRGKVEMRDLVVVLPFVFFGMTSQRAVFPATVVLASWAALAIPRLRIPQSSVPPRIAGTAMLMVGALSIAILFVRPLGVLDHERFPSPSIQEGMRGRTVFHDDVVGGFLIFDEWPTRPVLVDDRAELYGEEFFRENLEVRDGSYEEFFRKYGFDAALVLEDWGLTGRLDADGWQREIQEGSMILFYGPAD